MNDKNINTPNQNKILTALNFLLLSVMLTCFVFMFRGIALLIYPDLQAPGLLILTFIIALETLIIQHVLHEAYDSSQRHFPTALAELVLIIFIAKMITMPFGHPDSIWQEVSSWHQDFIENFLTKDFLFASFIALIVWVLARMFNQSLIELEENKNLMAQEKLGKVFTNRQLARRRLIGLIFILGFIMMAFMVIINSNQDLMKGNLSSSRFLFIILLAYFFSGFLFMAFNQYSIMKIRWYFNEVPVNPDLARRWVFYSIVFIFLATLLVIFLPTSFTLGLQPLVQALYEGMIFIIGILEIIFFIPIIYGLSLLNFLETGESVSEEFQETLPEYTSTFTSQVSSTADWWEVLKSVLFWLVFLGVIVFAIWYYFKNRKELRSFFSKIKVGAWLRDFWHWIKSGLKKAKQTTAETLQKSIQNVREYFQKQKVKLPSMAEILKNLPPRQMVVLTYISWVRWCQKQGIHRKDSQTPLEYARTCCRELPDAAEAIDTLTRIFILARYTRQSITKTDLEDTQSALASIKEAHHLKETMETSVV